MEKILFASTCFSLLLVGVRAIITGRFIFIFLPWNLFLAAVPFFISTRLIRRAGEKFQRGKFFFLVIGWILFIPNSFYIITDLFHLQPREESSRWYDLILIFSFAWNGLLLGILSVRQMERFVGNHFRLRHSLLFIFPIMCLIGMGVHIGRFMRFNSWDIVTKPFELVNEIGYLVIHPVQHFETWATIGCFAGLMTFVYLTLKKMSGIME